MSRLQILLIAFIAALVLSVGAGAGAWYYLYGAPAVSCAELVPADTLLFATIPNGTALATAYQGSQAQTLFSSPNLKPVQDQITQAMGQKNLDLLNTFLPNLSGQSFFAVTHFDADHPNDIGLIAAMKPKAGLGDFGAFLDKLKATYPSLLQGAQTGKSTVAGHDYDWIQGPGVPVKLCVANVRGWIVTTWGEATLQDWIERLEKRSTTSSLADNADYRTSLGRVGEDPMTLAYVNYHDLLGILQKQMAKTNPGVSDVFAKKLKDIGGAAIATRFENGQIVDRYSFLMPRQAQLAAGVSADPCPFDTLKFTSINTRFYWASSFNWKQYYASLKEQFNAEPNNPATGVAFGYIEDWLRQANLDFEHNVIDALGPEISVQAEWNDDVNYPEVGFFAKLDKPDDFKPVISAVLDTVRRQWPTSAVVKEINLNGQNFATINFVPAGMLSPTITEDGPYFGLFLTANQAVRSYQRDPAVTLAANASFKSQIGDQRNGAQQLIYLDSPYLLNRSYKLALPYLNMAAMFNKDLANALQGHQLPPDLTWLAPMGTWSCVLKNDDSGVQGYSISGVGNQGIFFAMAGGAGIGAAEASGMLNGLNSYLTPPAPAPPPMGFNPGAPPTPPVPANVPASNPPPPVPLTPAPAPAANSPTNASPSSPPTTP
jgi:hypothetical protein